MPTFLHLLHRPALDGSSAGRQPHHVRDYVDVKNTREDFFIDELEGNFDGLNFLANQNMSVVNRKPWRAPSSPIPTAAYLWV